jgi:UDP-N-acetylmuramoyl-tripeptide--D-alanyl-D-alanine ligase
MDELGYILAPDAALVINVGGCHLEGLGSLEGVAQQKSILLDHVRSGGFACVSADYPELSRECAKRSLSMVTFSGAGAKADYSCLRQENTAQGMTYTLRVKGEEMRCRVSANVHIAENMAAVASMAMELGMSLADVESALAEYSPVAQRFVQSRIGSWLFIDDTYNANPVSMRRSIREAARLAKASGWSWSWATCSNWARTLPRSSRAGRAGRADRGDALLFQGAARRGRSGRAGRVRGRFSDRWPAGRGAAGLNAVRNDEGVMLFKGSRGCKMEQYHSALERSWA